LYERNAKDQKVINCINYINVASYIAEIYRSIHDADRTTIALTFNKKYCTIVCYCCEGVHFVSVEMQLLIGPVWYQT
jgi:hypothetical protein